MIYTGSPRKPYSIVYSRKGTNRTLKIGTRRLLFLILVKGKNLELIKFRTYKGLVSSQHQNNGPYNIQTIKGGQRKGGGQGIMSN